ncbi:MAG: hypothetical protein LQ340_000881 [Diploschistes diacapsis]|nr:MAG: hypothetical protein LQ340_000881 [Diploschistes diacapsis]
MSFEQAKSVSATFGKVLDQLLFDPDMKLIDLNWFSEHDMRKVLAWNSNELSKVDKCIDDVFEEQALLRPDAEAVCSWDGSLSYSDLSALSCKLAGYLEELDVGPETFVPVCFDKSKYYIVACMAVLKAGGAFVPLDPQFPKARLQSLAQKINGKVLLCSPQHATMLESVADRIIPVDHDLLRDLRESPANRKSRSAPDNKAYMIFTSGTTGEPKGAVIEHGALLSSARAHGPAMLMDSETRSLQFAASTFDVSITEILTTLTLGGCVCVPSEHARLNKIEEAINSMRVNWALLTPTFVKFIDPADVPGFRTLVTGGEAMTQAIIRSWSHRNLVNCYGPAETSVVSHVNPFMNEGKNPLCIGRQVGVRCWVVDRYNHDRLMPVGSVGELLIEGYTLAREYYREEEKTAQAFICDPLWTKSQRPDPNRKRRRMYKTGDLVRHNLDGTLHIAGRKDTQVKFHGQRIEMGEIEHHINLDRNIKHGMVVLPKAGFCQGRLVTMIQLADGDNQDLVRNGQAFKFLDDGLKKIAEEHTAGTREMLSKRLPPYMVPSMWLVVEFIPRLQSGKLDRKRVARWIEDMGEDLYRQLNPASEAAAGSTEPVNETERELQAAWAHVLNLNLDQVGLQQSFLSLGGDSISAMQVMGNCRKRGIGLTVHEILRSKSISHLSLLAKTIQTASHFEETVDQPFALSPIQRLYFARSGHADGHYNQSFLLRANLGIQETDLRKALELVIQRHSMLRARFSRNEVSGEWQQRVTNEIASSYRLRSLTVNNRSAVDSKVAQSQTCLNELTGPMLAADLIDVNGEEQLLFVVGHHLIIDLVSWRVILQDVEELLLDPNASLEKPMPFQTWCRLQEEHCRSLTPAQALPLEDIPSGDAEYWGMQDQRHTYGNMINEGFEIDSSITSLLLTKCHDALRTDIPDILIAALIYSFAHTFQDRPPPPIFAEGHGRESWDPAVDLSRTVGWFTTIYPVYVSAARLSETLVNIVRYVKDNRRKIPGKGRPYFASRWLTAEGQEAFGRHWPLEVTFNYLGQYQQLERKDALLTPAAGIAGETRGAGGAADVGPGAPCISFFEISAVILQGALRFSFTFNKNMSHQQSIRRWISTCRDAICAAAEELSQRPPETTLSDFPLLPLTYGGLEDMKSEKLPRAGVPSLDLVEDVYPCSPMQEGLLVSTVKDSLFYAAYTLHEVKARGNGKVDANRLAQAWQTIVNRHPMLRTIFIESVSERDALYDQVVLKKVDAHSFMCQEATDEEAVQNLSGQQIADYDDGTRPLHRFTICTTSSGKVFCRLEISHVVMDGTSLSIVFRDLALAYEGKIGDGPGPLYSDYIKYLLEQPVQPAIEHWRSYLTNVEPCHFPVLNDAFSGGSSTKELKCVRVTFEKLHELQKHCDQEGLTFANALHTAWALTLRCYTDSEEVCFGYLTSARDGPIEGAQDGVGPYINMLVCRVIMEDSLTLKGVMSQVQQDYLDSLPYRHTPLAEVQHALHLSNVSLFNTALSYRKLPPAPDQEPLVSFVEVAPTYDPDEYNVSINIEAGENEMAIDLAYWTDCLSDGQAQNVASTFTQSLTNILDHSKRAIGQLNNVSQLSHQQIEKWNDLMPEVVDDCVHNVFKEQVALRPHAPAICGWDACYTYAELDAVSSKLAHHLRQLGVGPESFVLTCFEKSAYAIISMLAVLKAGGACVPLDAKFPRSALELRANDTAARVILAAPQCAETVTGLVPEVLFIDEGFLSRLPTASPELSTSVRSHNACFIIFTSGSTGKPKGVVLEHRGITTSARAHGPLLGYTPESRVLQFASYTFDNSLAEIFTTLMRGGCVCVPSEHDRLNNLAGAINSLRVNFMDITPTVATFLGPSEVPTLKRLALGGEAVTKRVVDIWGEAVSMHACYGPSECSINCAYSGDIATPGKATNIGRACGCILWVVDSKNHDRLVPIGCTGELLVEGPIVARGYLHDPERTAKAFVENPAWAKLSSAGTRRMYKTGDLVRYESDGTLMYLGRKDTQVKLNGQRIELGEIEHHVERNLPEDAQSAVELAILGESQTSKKALAAFICLKGDGAVPDAHTNNILLSMSDPFKQVAKSLEIALTSTIPAYMVPTSWIPLAQMPLTSSGKLNRRQLRLLAQSIPDERVATYRLAGKSGRAPATEMEKKLAALWTKILILDENAVGAEDSFFKLGGDSIGAMRLVSAARSIGLSLTVANVFQRSKLCEMASAANEMSSTAAPSQIAPFAMISGLTSIPQLKSDLSALCRVDPEAIQDIYPSTSIQEGLMALSIKEPGAYVAQMVYRLPSDVDMNRFRAAWDRVVDVEMTLRTRIAYTEKFGFLQVVVRSSIQWHSVSDLYSLSDTDRQIPAYDGGELSRYSIVGEDTGSPYFVWTVHHALYDGWCLPLILDKVKAAYYSASMKTTVAGPSYATFIYHLTKIDQARSDEFWRTTLAGVSSSQFPRLPNPSYQARASAMMSHKAKVSRKSGSEITAASTIRAAWALTVAAYSGSEDVVFCETVTGRDAPVNGIEDMIGATLTTVPTRVRIDKSSKIIDFLRSTQAQSAASTQFQYAGLQRIKRLGSDAAAACESQNLIAINSGSKESAKDAFWDVQNNDMAGTNFYTYPLMLSCYSDTSEVEVDAHYDEDLIPAWQMERILRQFGFVLSHLAAATENCETLAEIDLLSPEDKSTIARWNSEPLLVVDKCVHDIVYEQGVALPKEQPAVCAWDASFTYRELDFLACRLASNLIQLGIRPNMVVPLCFEKSAYTVVAMLAVLKAGASFVPLQADHPEARLRDIVQDVEASVALCSPRYESICSKIVAKAVSVDQNTMQAMHMIDHPLPCCETNSAAYIIFTSGTTGKPKGTVVEHAAFCTSARAHGSVMQIQETSRVLQFASHTFDASVMEILTTLICGGCVCIPDDISRLNDCARVINEMQVNWSLLTPSFVQTIKPSEVPSLRTLVMGGEAMSQTQISVWAEKVNFMNAYGPSETSVIATINANVTAKSGPTNIGRAVGGRCWIANYTDHDYLAPIGSVGELLVEGPILARGYLKNPGKTAEAFIENPKWASRFGYGIGKRMYKTGDLVKYAADGSIIYLGRKDTQAKLHGQRLELGEVEHHLNTDGVIKHALAAIPASGPCKKRLVAVVSIQALSIPKHSLLDLQVVGNDAAAFYLTGIRERISNLLPPYMVPSTWIVLQELPLQPSGKLDRRRVITFVESMSEDLYRQVSEAESSSDSLDRDATPIELQVRAIWAHVLNIPVEKISFTQSFLHLGGDSISAMQVMARCRSEKLGVTVQDIIQSKNLSQLASRVTLPQEVSYQAEEVERDFALSPIQQMYFELMGDDWAQFNQSVLFKLRHKTSIDQINRAIYVVVEAHSMLRARFAKTESQVWQQRVSRDIIGSYVVRSHTRGGDAIDRTSSLIEDSQKSLNITKGPIVAVDLFEGNSTDKQQLLFLTAHHLVVDVVSWRVIIQDIEDFLTSGSLKTPTSLPFQTWCNLQAEHAKHEVAKRVLQNEDIPPADFAYWNMTDRANVHGDALSTTFELDAQTTLHLTNACHDALRTDAVDILMATMLVSFGRTFSDREYLPAIYNEGHGREPWDSIIDLSQTVGWFTTMCPVYLPGAAASSPDLISAVRWIKDYRRRVPDKGRPYFAYRHLTSEGKARFSTHWPMEITFNYLGQIQQLERDDALLLPVDALSGDSINAQSDIAHNTPRFSLFEVSAFVTSGSFKISVSYNKHMQRQPEIRKWIAEYETTLRSAVSQLAQLKPELTLTDFPLLPLTYDGLSKLTRRLPELGVASIEDIEDVYPCSPMQQGLLLAQVRNPQNYTYHAIFEVTSKYAGQLVDTLRLSKAWQAVIDRHPALRTVFLDNISQPGVTDQVVLKNFTARMSWLQSADSEAILGLQQQEPLDYSLFQPPHCLSICKGTSGRVFCKLEMSHVISDGTSMPIILGDLSKAYEASGLEKGPLYSDYLAHVKWKTTAADVDYWKSYLMDIEPCYFPTLIDGKQSARQLKSLDIESPLTPDMQAFCARNGVTLANALQLTWALVLKCYTGSSDVCFGYLVSGRDVPVPGIQQAVGAFINMLTCRINLLDGTRVNEAMQQVQTDFVNGMSHQSCSLAEVQHELKMSGSALFNTAFTFQRRSGTKDLAENSLQYDFAEACDPSEYHVTVNVETSDSTMVLGFTYWSDGFSEAQIQGVASVFQQVLKCMTLDSNRDSSLGELDFFSERSIEQALRWNSKLPQKVNRCIHDFVEEHARTRPSATPAINGWDGNYTYAELDSVTDRLAQHLVTLGIGLENIVPLCFEKSSLTIVAMLAVMKAGATFVPIDSTQPESRLKYLFESTQAKLVLCSPGRAKKISAIINSVSVVSQESLAALPAQALSNMIKPTPDNAAYIIFTSGTTGLPKGTIIEHAAFCTGATEHAKAMMMRSNSRVLQFASYTFDASVMEILSTLIAGGCVCVPTDQERMNDIPGIIKRMGITWTLLTPSVASILRPDSVPSLRVLVTGGEAMSADHIRKWQGSHIALVNAYGPSECSVIATLSVKVDEGGREINGEPANIGHAIGGRNWVVNPNNHDQLVPTGAIGELVVEGRTTARGYLNNEEKTKAAFIADPAWTRKQAFGEIFVHRERMYKTGDLVRCNSDGSFTYITRKDTQIKLNGQRIEVAEIEHHVKQNLPDTSQAAVDLVAPVGGRKALAVFFSVPASSVGRANHARAMSAVDEILLPISGEASTIAKNMEVALGGALPAYMVPSLFIPVRKMPWTTSGKLDRSRLRNMVQALSKEDIISYKLGGSSSKRATNTAMEKRLQKLWETVIGLPAGSVGADDNFFRIGGDSISAMKLVGLADAENLILTVLNIFRNPKLSELARTCTTLKKTADPELQQFALLKQAEPVEQTLHELASQCRIEVASIQDAYPCSPLQEGLLTLSMKQAGAYVAKNVFKVPSNADVGRLQAAWQQTVDEVDILRTRIVHTKSSAFVQVVLKTESITWKTVGTLREAESDAIKIPLFNGGTLAQYTIVNGSKPSTRYFVWSIHHALYDGWSMPMVLERFESNYRATEPRSPQLPYSRFIQYLGEVDWKASDEYWKSKLSETSALRFPAVNLSTSEDTFQSKKLTHSVRISRDFASTGVTLPTIIRAAWALVIATYTSSNDVVFGETLAGRDIPVPGITSVLGPTLTTIPQRVRLDKAFSLQHLLQEIHQLSAEVIPYQHAGLQHIRCLSSDAETACDFQNLLVIQTAGEGGRLDLLRPQDDGVSDSFFTYPLVLECTANVAQIDIEAHYDLSAMSEWQMERLLYQFDSVLKQLGVAHRNPGQTISEVQVFSPQDMQLVRDWNYNAPIAFDECIHKVFAQLALRQPESPAVCAWDMNLTYRELHELAVRLAGTLSRLNVGREGLVPVVIDKSGWSIVSMMAILLAGGAFVPLDSAHPTSRHIEIINNVQATVLITPPQYVAKYKDHVEHVVTIDEASMSAMGGAGSFPDVDSNNTAYVIFTSGSTGKPKGVVIEHGAFCSSSNAFRREMFMKPDSRVLQFASLTFDAGVMEVFTTLTFGGCVCIPSDEARVKDLESVIRDMNVTWTFLTPSVANIMDPSLVPCLQVLSCGGEALSEETVLRWADNVTLVNGYGPTEASVFAVLNPHVSRDRDATCIGRGHAGGYTWITEPDNHDRLAPVGSDGELCLEGPLLAREYINDEEKTNAAFIKDAAWMKAFDNGTDGRRIYKTGDLVRYHKDGSIIFVGRKDNQVKLHGQRMELGEIEHRLEVCPQIKHVFVALPKHGLCQKRLVGVVSIDNLPGAPGVPAANSCNLMAEGQRLDAARAKVAEASTRLADQVPGYMVPSIWVILEALPILVSGKLDRKKVGMWLENMDEPTYRAVTKSIGSEDTSSPQTPTAQVLRQVWASVFDMPAESIKFNESFLSLGGDSISAMRVMAKGRKEGLNLSLQDILRSKSISQLAAVIGDIVPGSSADVVEEEVVDRAFDVSPIQSLFFESIGGNSGDAQFNQSYLLEIRSKVTVDDVRNALEAVIGKHSMLRSRFAKSSDNKWQQRVTNNVVASYRFSAHNVPDKQSMASAIADSQTNMNIEEGPLLSSNLFNIQDGRQGLFLAIHHLVVDAVSWLVILQDLQDVLSKKPLTMDKPLPFQVWCNMQAKNAQNESASNIQKLLPVGFAPAQRDYWGLPSQGDTYGDADSISFTLDQEITSLALGNCHQSLRTEPVDVFLSAIAQSFTRIFTDRKTATIFNEGHGREPWDPSIDLSRTVGWFTTMYPLHVDLDYNEDSVNIVKRMKDARRKVPNNGRPYFASRYITAEGRSRFQKHMPMEILFNYLGRTSSVGKEDSLLEQMEYHDDEKTARLTADVGPKTPRLAVFEISAAVSDGRIRFAFMFNRNLENIESVKLWVKECQLTLHETVQKLATISKQPTLSDFPLLPLSYRELERLTTQSLTKSGITNLEEVEDIYPCSPMQEGLLLSQSRDPKSYIFHTVSEVKPLWFDSAIDAQKLVTAWQMVVDRHPALRTVFIDSVYKGGVFDQIVVRKADSGALSIECSDTEVLDTLAAITIQDQNFKKQPKLPHQFTVCKTRSGNVFFKLEINHAVIDGASSGNIMHDLALAYEGRLVSGSGPLYSDYISYLKEQGPTAGIEYWKTYLNGVRPSLFPALNSATAVKQLGSAPMRFGRYAELQDMSKKLNVTLSNVMHAAWAVVLRSYMNANDVSFGYLTAGRDAPIKGIQDAVGAFINMLICRIEFKPEMTLADLFTKVQNEYLESLPHQHSSLAQVQHELKIPGKALFNTAVSIQGSSSSDNVEGNTISFETMVAHDPSEYAVTVNVNVTPGDEGVVFRYWTNVLSDIQAAELAETMASLLQSMIENPNQTIGDMDKSRAPTQMPVTPSNGTSVADLRPLIKDCVQEVIEHMFKSGSLIQYKPNEATALPTIKVDQENRRRNTITQAENEKVLKTIAAEITAARPTKEMVKANEIVQKVKELKPKVAVNVAEKKFLTLWSDALDMTEDSIDSNDSFFELGGDSITAMEMVGAAREAGLSMTVADVFQNPTFVEMLSVVRSTEALEAISSGAVSSNASREVITYAVANETYEPFSLLETEDVPSFLQNHVCSQVNVFKGGLADVMPLTDFQTLSVTASLLESRWMLNYFYLDGRGEVDIKRLRQSVSKLTQTYDILRTVFIPYGDRFLQVVLRQMEPDFSVVETEHSLEGFTAQLHEKDINNPPRLGQSSLQFILAKLKDTDRHRILIRIHHAQYDGIGLAKILTALQAGYNGLQIASAPSFSRFVNHAIGRNTNAHYDYWKGLLHGSLMTEVVHRQKPNYNRACGETITLAEDVVLPSLAAHNITDATVIKAAWALVIAELTAQSDVTFGNLVNGRAAPINGVEHIIGPCLNIIPVRIMFQPYWTVLDLLRSVQEQHVASMSYENLGFREIIKHCTEWPNWTNFTTCVQHQNMGQHSELKLGKNEYKVGNLGSNEDFADFSVVSTPKDSNLVEISLIYASDGQIPSDFAEKAHRMLCETVTNFSEHPHWTLLNPKKLIGMPCQILDEQRISEDSSVLHATDNLTEAQLQILFDMVGPAWQAVLPRKEDGGRPNFNVDSNFFDLGGDVTGLALISVNLQGQGFAVSIEDLLDNPTMRDQMGLISLQHFKHLDRADRQSISGSDTSTLADADEFAQRMQQQQRRPGSSRLGRPRPSIDNMWKKSMNFMGKFMKRGSMTMLNRGSHVGGEFADGDAVDG